MRNERELRKDAAHFAEEAHHLPDDTLYVVLTADDDEGRDLAAQQHAVRDRDLVLNAVHALDHLVVERARAAPTDRRRNENDVGPMHERFVDAVELVLRVHLRDAARPRAGARGLRVEALARPKLELVELDQA